MTDFWNGLGWMRTGVWPALSVAACPAVAPRLLVRITTANFLQHRPR